MDVVFGSLHFPEYYMYLYLAQDHFSKVGITFSFSFHRKITKKNAIGFSSCNEFQMPQYVMKVVLCK